MGQSSMQRNARYNMTHVTVRNFIQTKYKVYLVDLYIHGVSSLIILSRSIKLGCQ